MIKKALEQHRQAEQSEQERKQREKAERLARNFDDLLALIKEPQEKGIEKAKKQGRYKGRKPASDKKQLE